jgi:hypothetical protein
MPPPQLEAIDFIICELLHDGLMKSAQFKKVGVKNLINRLAYGCNLNLSAGLSPTDYREFVRQAGPHGILDAYPTTPSTQYPNSYMARNKFIGEASLVTKVFGVNRATLKNQIRSVPGPFTMYNRNVRVRRVVPVPPPPAPTASYTYNTVMETIRMNYYCEPAYTLHTIMRDLFNHNSNNSNDIYFVCDAGSYLIEQISSCTSLPGGKHYHCMFSSSTFGDPATLVDPTNASIIGVMHTPGIYKYTHVFTQATTRNKARCNRFTLLPITVTHTVGGTTVNKTITHANHIPNPPNPPNNHRYYPLNYPNSRLETTISSLLPTIGLEASLHRKLWIAQSKRLGDHEQVSFADWIINNPNELTAVGTTHTYQVGLNAQVAGLPAGFPNPPVPPLPLRNALTLPNRRNVYYVTVDIPAFCFAVFNRISAILIVMSTHGYVIAQFT